MYPLILTSSDYAPAQSDGGIRLVTDSGAWTFRNDGVLSTGNVSIHGHMIPTEDNTFDLGSPDKEFRHIYTANGSIYLGNVKLSNDGGVLAVYSVDNRGQVTETNTAVALKTDRLTTGSKEAVLGSDGNITLPADSGMQFTNGTINTVGGGLTARAYNGNFTITVDETQLPTTPYVAWTFGTAGNLTVPGTITFSDGTVQSTAYDYAPVNLVNLDGGFATTQFDHSYVYVDCGGSKRRGVLAEDTFDGDVNGATTTVFAKTLNGGGA
jgi:hypothetical protein